MVDRFKPAQQTQWHPTQSTSVRAEAELPVSLLGSISRWTDAHIMTSNRSALGMGATISFLSPSINRLLPSGVRRILGR
jgi:hypothetical protein